MAPTNKKKMQERVMHMLKDPLWAGKPFWLLNLFEFNRDADGSTDTGRAQLKEYIRAAQQYYSSCTGGTPSDWFKKARLVSYNCASFFPESHGRFDACVMYEYASPEEFMEMVMGSAAYEKVGEVRKRGIIREVQVAVKPTVWMDSPDAVTQEQESQARVYANAFWEATRNGKDWAARSKDEQIILPKPESALPIMRNEALASKPFFALNLWKFKEGLGRELYKEYADSMIPFFKANMPDPSGGICLATPCLSLSDDVEWDEVAAMQYPNFMGIAKLQSMPGYETTGVNREKGLLQQGLVLVEPMVVNGVVVSAPEKFTDGEGLKVPVPPTMSKL